MKKFISMFLLFVFSTILSFSSEIANIQILVTSDLHGKFMPYEYSTASASKKGSMVQLATLIKELKTTNKNTLLLDNGDAIQDNSHELFLNGDITPLVEFFNYVGYDAMVPGNHEFNFGMDTLNKVIKPFNGDLIVANLYKDNKRVYNPYKIFKIDHVKIALIGVVTPHIKKWDAENLKDYTVTNPVEEVKKVVSELKNKADIIIVSAHMQLDPEFGGGDSTREIALNNPEVAMVFTGHEHALRNERTPSGTLLLEPGKWGEFLGKIDLKVTKEKGKWIIANRATDIVAENIPTKDIEPDAELVAKLDKYHQIALKDSATIIGDLIGGDLVRPNEIIGIPIAQLEPTPMVQLINEVQMYYTKADVASTAVLREDANIPEGPIKKSDIAMIYKYDNTLRAYRLTGAQLKKYMEWSASYYNTLNPGDLTISFNENIRAYNYDIFSGVNYEINISKPAGKRIENLRKLDGTPIKASDTFVVAVNDYRGKSTFVSEKDGLFKPNEIELVVDLFQTMGDNGRIRELIKEYISTVKGRVITPEVVENWQITGISWNTELHNKIPALVSEGKLSVPRSSDGRTPNIKSITVTDLENIK